MILTKQQAQEISHIMGYHYSHHRVSKYNDSICGSGKDENPTIYFYPGMSLFTFKIDTVTGKVSIPYSDTLDLLSSVHSALKSSILEQGGVPPAEIDETDYKDYLKRCGEVKEYLINNKFL